MKQKKTITCIRGCWKSFCIIFFCKKYLARDIALLSFLIVALGLGLGWDWYSSSHDIRKREVVKVLAEETEMEIIPKVEVIPEAEAVQIVESSVQDIQSKIDTSTWKLYQNNWYGFTVKYPEETVSAPVMKNAPAGAMWVQKYEFRFKQTKEDIPFEGFDVVIYNVAKTKELANTDEFPKLKAEERKGESGCAAIEGHLIEADKYPAEEIYIPPSDACFTATLFFSNTRDEYIYNLVPKLKEGVRLEGDPAQDIASFMPEFYAAASTFELVDIQRPKPVAPAPKVATPAKPKINAPMPVSYKKENGRLVCAKKNDKPAKSKKGKGKHLDMECCLDPDEYPNPHCYYPPGKYGKYLK